MTKLLKVSIMSNRKQTEEFILTHIEKIIPGQNKQIYQDMFSKMSDEDFDQFIQDLESEKKHLCIIAPNLNKENKLNLKNLLALAKELGHNFFQRIWVPATNDTREYLTPIPYMVVDLPIRRQAQLLSKKISIPEDNNSVDDFTGQPTGKSKGSKVSYPEVQVMAALGLKHSLVEFLKYRGGDEKGFNAMNTIIDRTGTVSIAQASKYANGVKSTKTLKYFLLGLHLRPTGLNN